jgi:hypothetical protein
MTRVIQRACLAGAAYTNFRQFMVETETIVKQRRDSARLTKRRRES